ncbi:MAG: hypothetical protein R3337_09770 [Gammaproteobacteria bacterium]|nr:hypothetical protein [Gammaproteobacteria bacterium]
MAQRGRASAAAQAVVPPEDDSNVVGLPRRPRPPKCLNEEQAAEWTDVVKRLPADWFPRETHQLLIEYCRHVVVANRISREIEKLMEKHPADGEVGEFDEAKNAWKGGLPLSRLDALCKAHARETKLIENLATKMRMTQQSSYDPEKKKGRVGDAPWSQ